MMYVTYVYPKMVLDALALPAATKEHVQEVSLFQFKLGLFMCGYMTLQILLLAAIFILPMKKIFGRERPSRIPRIRRLCNMRDLEHGKSMPSGDAAACAFFCGIYWYIFGVHWYMYIALPLTSLGRVFTQCHWILDTVAGSILGLAFVYFTYAPSYFEILATPLFYAFFKVFDV